MKPGRKRKRPDKGDNSKESDGSGNQPPKPKDKTPEEKSDEAEVVLLPTPVDDADETEDAAGGERKKVTLKQRLLQHIAGRVQRTLVARTPTSFGRSTAGRVSGVSKAFSPSATAKAGAAASGGGGAAAGARAAAASPGILAGSGAAGLGAAAALATVAAAGVGAFKFGVEAEGFFKGLGLNFSSERLITSLLAPGPSALARIIGGPVEEAFQSASEDLVGKGRTAMDFTSAVMNAGLPTAMEQVRARGLLAGITGQSLNPEFQATMAARAVKNDTLKAVQQDAFDRTLRGVAAEGVGKGVHEVMMKVINGNTAR